MFWLQSAAAEVDKQKQISNLNAISAVFTEQSLFLLKQSSSLVLHLPDVRLCQIRPLGQNAK